MPPIRPGWFHHCFCCSCSYCCSSGFWSLFERCNTPLCLPATIVGGAWCVRNKRALCNDPAATAVAAAATAPAAAAALVLLCL